LDIAGWIRIGSEQGPRNIPKFRKVQPFERPDLQVAARWMCAARPIVVVPVSQAATAFFVHRMKEPDEGWHGRIM
jgi:hypothetical protein